MFETVPLEQAAAISMATDCFSAARDAGLIFDCHDGAGCSTSDDSVGLLGLIPIVAAALSRSRRRPAILFPR
ncbi:hypothetical protein AKJ08_0034 [Vulgatibacter incomptus]|uniref:Uncharacterized protein n=2 Tax=Vulgatibacter incomptus TaxID=1391653 RepID=A0A0K1P811_9BACT|nr:hypothetical protein AKJ08_0034 [Vulgatibacter incomptus]